MVKSVRDSRGHALENYHTDSKSVLDPRVAYVLTTMMESVVNSGTGYTVRARGFQTPAAGKTGTSHDAWFAGYTTNLLCIVWVGNDDYTDLKLSGSSTAAPIWAEFMKRAVKLPQYSDAKNFPAPSGVVEVTLDKVTNRLATSSCPAGLHRRFYRRHRAEGDLRRSLQLTIGGSSPRSLDWARLPPLLRHPRPMAPLPVRAGQRSRPRTGSRRQPGQPTPAKKKKGFFSSPLRQGRQRR